MRPNILLMFSGGLDSTGAFWKLINQENDLHVHHMHLINKEKRSDAESIAVNEIINYMKKIKNFSHTDSIHEYPSYNGNFIWDGDIASFIAGTICLSMPSIKEVAFGRTATDDENPRLSSRIDRANKIFKAMCNANKIYPVQSLTKVQIYEDLPTDLRELCWSCRKPIYVENKPVRCNKCITCKQMINLGI